MHDLAIIIVSFVPVFLLEAQEGRMFRPLAFTKTSAMALASLLSITLVPVLMTVRGSLLIFGTLLLAILIPLLTHLHFGRRYAWCIPAAAWCG